MGYSWVYIGDAKIPAASRQAWLEASTDPSVHADLLGAKALEGWGLADASLSPTVRELLELLAEEDGARVTWDGPIVVRVLADKSMDAWLTYRANLAAAFAALGAHGGQGRLTVVGFDDGPDEGFLVEVRRATTARSLTTAEVAKARASAGYAEVNALYGAFLEQQCPDLLD
jgi:hypothetical protein